MAYVDSGGLAAIRNWTKALVAGKPDIDVSSTGDVFVSASFSDGDNSGITLSVVQDGVRFDGTSGNHVETRQLATKGYVDTVLGDVETMLSQI